MAITIYINIGINCIQIIYFTYHNYKKKYVYVLFQTDQFDASGQTNQAYDNVF